MGWHAVISGLDYPESLRWRDGALWLSDFYQRRVIKVESGRETTVVEVPGQPSGLGWLPDSTLLIVEMRQRRLLGWTPSLEPWVYADLADLCTGLANDLHVVADGCAYVGHLGFDYFGGERFQPAELIAVTPDRRAAIAARDLALPNGCSSNPSGTRLVVAETFGSRLICFDRSPDGELNDRRVYCELPGVAPDGMCGDPDGDLWVADAVGQRIVHLFAGVPVGQRRTPAPVFSCVTDDDRRSLFIAVADGHDPTITPPGTGKVLTCSLATREEPFEHNS